MRQILMSRAEGEDSIYDAVDLYAYAVRMFSFARDTDAVRQKATKKELKSALRSSGIWDDDHPRLYALIDKRGTDDQAEE
jgi:hypothetical protein